MAPKRELRRGDYYSEIQKYLADFEFHISEENIKEMPDNYFKALVKKQAIGAAMKYLKQKQSDCDKGSNIEYKDLDY